jgi:hypothetical protein
MNKSYLTAIIFCTDHKTVMEVLKYHDIRNTEKKIQTFLTFAKGRPFAKYVNFYYKTTSKAEKGQNFAFRRYINQ